MRILSTSKRAAASMVMAAALASTSLVAVSPSVALAAPEGGYADLVDQVSPSVVFIEVTSRVSPAGFEGQLPEGMPDMFKHQFRDMFPNQGAGRERQGVGSGFIISKDGEIVTNAHVVDGAEKVTVKLSDGRSYEATVLGSDPMTDVALLKIEADVDLPAVGFGTSEDLRVGDEVMAVGNPFGLGGTVTTGIVSALSRNINAGPYDDFIQTDAAINRGNSGGPLFDTDGNVIGMNTAIISPMGGSVGIGFAVPSDMVRNVVADLQDDGTVDRGWLGVAIRPMTDEVASVLGYDQPKGAVVQGVSEGSPADKAGLREGDIILSFNGTAIDELRDLTRAVADTKPDASAKVVLLRKGEELTKDVRIGALDKHDA
ncbi:Do family serine endopeptidase [Sulfitobacter sp. LCG007]